MTDTIDLAVIGAGPCGIAVGAAAAGTGTSTVLFDRGPLTASLLNYPYYMTFFSTAQKLEIGGVPFTIPDPRPTRREALAYYRRVVKHYHIDVRQHHAVTAVVREGGGFRLTVRRRDGETVEVTARNVAVATGGFHEPNALGVPGEGLPKVHHYYHEPYPFTDQDVLVVGAGNSAVEAALEMYRNDVRVQLVHFADRIDKGVKPWVVPDITNRLEKGEIPVHWGHRVAEIRWNEVVLRHVETGETRTIPNDAVVAMTGWRANPTLLRALGVTIDDETGIPRHDPATMETDVPGVYIAGVLAAGHNANKIFIENGKEHGGRIIAALRKAPVS
jgi:thioredoxin reductase (NADPH)